MDDIDFSEHFYYDETSPSCLRWKVDRFWGKNYSQILVSKGDKAGSLNSRRYWFVNLNGRSIRVHRVIWRLIHGFEADVIDHLDGDTTNNVFSNLQSKTRKANGQNKSASVSNTSGKCGVLWDVPHRDYPGSVYACAIWHGEDGKQCRKKFSVKGLGLLPAYAAACAYRESKIEELNVQGAAYTERHGKRLPA